MDVGGTGEFTAEMLCAFMEMTDSKLEIIDEKERRLSKNMPDPMARKTTLRGEGLVLARRMSIISDTSDDGEDAASQMRRASRAFDPRPQQEVDDD